MKYTIGIIYFACSSSIAKTIIFHVVFLRHPHLYARNRKHDSCQQVVPDMSQWRLMVLVGEKTIN